LCRLHTVAETHRDAIDIHVLGDLPETTIKPGLRRKFDSPALRQIHRKGR
jgi:hypothetical protein